MSAAAKAGGRSLGRVLVVDADSGPNLNIIDRGGSARAVIWPGMGAELRSLHRISLEPGGRTVGMRHGSECVYYVIAGGGAVCGAVDAPEEPLIEGSMVHIEAGAFYALCAGAEEMELVGGPAPADHALYEGLDARAGA